MNHDYKLKFDQMRENQVGQTDAGMNDQLYFNAGYNRNVVFVWPNGDSEAFNYAYLVSLKYKVEESAIYLVFTNDTVKLTGYGLRNLYYELFDQRNRIVTCIDPRYEAIEETETAVTDITVLKNK